MQKAFENDTPYHLLHEPVPLPPVHRTSLDRRVFAVSETLRRWLSLPVPIRFIKTAHSPMSFKNREDILARLGLLPLDVPVRDNEIISMPGRYTENPLGEVALIWQPLKDKFRQACAGYSLYLEVAAGLHKISMRFTRLAERPNSGEMQLDAISLHVDDAQSPGGMVYELNVHDPADAPWVYDVFEAARLGITCLRGQNEKTAACLAEGLKRPLREIRQKLDY